MSTTAVETTCSVKGCANPGAAIGFCHTHYARFWRYGDPTVIKTKGPKVAPGFAYLITKGHHKGERCKLVERVPQTSRWLVEYQDGTRAVKHRSVMKRV
jgi:hypothetical protein